MDTIEAATNRIHEAQKARHELVVRTFPVGTRVTWRVRDVYHQYGTVEGVSDYWWSEPRVYVRNEKTDKLVDVFLWQGIAPALEISHA